MSRTSIRSIGGGLLCGSATISGSIPGTLPPMSRPTTHRVLSVIHGPVFGGAHNQLVKLDPALREAGFETVAVLPPEAEAAARRIEAAGIEVVRLPLGSFRLSRDPALNVGVAARARSDIRALRGLIRRLGVDVVQVHGVINPHAGLAAHLEDVAVSWQLLDSRAPMALRRAVMPVVRRIADSITSWGRRLAETHPGASAFGARLLIVYPPIDPGLAPDPDARRVARAELGVAADAPLVGTLGVRNTQKGHEYFIRSAAIVKRERPDARFRVIGAPSPNHMAAMDAVEAEAEALGLRRPEDIEFVDPGERATALLHGLDLFVLSSVPHSEGMPTVLAEAMAIGVPVIATDVGSVAELLADGQAGVLVPPRAHREIATAILELLADAAAREAIAAAGRRRCASSYQLGPLADRHAQAYRVALDHRAQR